MQMRRIATTLFAGLALAAGTLNSVLAADGVKVNLDALGPEPTDQSPKKPSKSVSPDAVRSVIVPDPEPMNIGAPKPAKPKVVTKPDVSGPTPAVSTPIVAKPSAPPDEIDFIGRTKKAQGIAETEPAAPPVGPSKPKVPAPPVMATPIPDEPPPAANLAVPAPQLVTPAPVAANPTPGKPAPKPKASPQNVVVNSGAIDGETNSSGTPLGTPLTSIQPDGVLYVPKNVDALPQPVSVPSSPQSPDDTDEAKPLTLPPSLPDAPVLPTPPANTSGKVAPPSTQTVAAAVPAAAKPATAPGRAGVLTGQATATEIKFDPGQETLTAEAQAALDQIAGPIKSTGLRVQLASYSGPPGNNSSDARRLSLKRALAVREYLGTRGVQKLTVNIAAFGGAVSGQTDRVDVMVRTDQLARLKGAQ